MKVYKADTLAPWFREATAGAIRTWLAHLLYLRDQRFGRVHYAGSVTLASASGQPPRTVRHNTRWLEKRGVLVRVRSRWGGSNTTVAATPARLRELGGIEALPGLAAWTPPSRVILYDPSGEREARLDDVVEQAVGHAEGCSPGTHWIRWDQTAGQWVNVAQLPYTRAWLFLGERPRRGPTPRSYSETPTPPTTP